jgi:hypothetical protein
MVNLSYLDWAIPIEAFVQQKNPASPKVSLRTGWATLHRSLSVKSGVSLGRNEAFDVIHPRNYLVRCRNKYWIHDCHNLHMSPHGKEGSDKPVGNGTAQITEG